MTSRQINRVTVIGAGTMGMGIAQVAAMAGVTTIVTDANAAVLEGLGERVAANLQGAVKRGKLTGEAAEAALRRLSVASSLEDAVAGCDVVVEAIVEDLTVKQQLFARVGAAVGRDTILATNTSSLSIAAIAAAVPLPERVIGMHFFNPVHIMKLVELVVHDRTSPEIVEQAKALSHRFGKEPIVVRDSPGFASSRLGVAIGLEAMRMLEEGVASAVDIDTAMELGYGHPMGPLRVSDLVGLDVRLRIAEYLHVQLQAPHFEPPRILREKVAAGELGKKTGKGFFDWSN